MLARRAFLQSTVALPAVLAGWPLKASERAASASAPAPDVAIADRGLDGSSSFISRARVNGSRPFEFANDVAGVWMRELEPRLRLSAVSIAGYTSAATLFCLELLALDYGARIVERREHGAAVAWILSSSPSRRGPLAPSHPSKRG